MTSRRPQAGVDFSEVRARADSIGAGVRLTLVVCAAGWLYVAATWDRPDRQLIASLFGLGAIVALLFVLIPHERVVRSRWREPFFLLWSVTQIALTTVVVAADGGATSPLALLFFMPGRVRGAVVSARLGGRDRGARLPRLHRGGSGGGPAGPGVRGVLRALPRRASPRCAGGTRASRSAAATRSQRVSRADPLTGCLNRRGFEERFDAELSSALRNGRPFGLISLDLDHFKEINDTRGHAAGDDLLRWAVEVMNDTVRPMDTVGRVGGDEFAVIVPGAGPDDSAAIARRLQDALADAGAGLRGRRVLSRRTGPTATSCSARPTSKLYAGKRGARDAGPDDRARS